MKNCVGNDLEALAEDEESGDGHQGHAQAVLLLLLSVATSGHVVVDHVAPTSVSGCGRGRRGQSHAQADASHAQRVARDVSVGHVVGNGGGAGGAQRVAQGGQGA